MEVNDREWKWEGKGMEGKRMKVCKGREGNGKGRDNSGVIYSFDRCRQTGLLT